MLGMIGKCLLALLCIVLQGNNHVQALQHNTAIVLPSLKKWILPVISGISLFSSSPSIASSSREIANIPTSGLVFKDSLRVSAFEDPKVAGVVLYLSDFDRPLTEKLAKDFFNDPSSSSLTCAKTGPITFSKDINLSSEGEEVFEESRNLFFKQIRVRRIIDKQTKTIVYVAYNTRFNKNDDQNKARFKSSLCAINSSD